MRVVIQRVLNASVSISGAVTAAIGPGLLVLLGICEEDGEEDIQWLVKKIAGLRIFDDENGVVGHFIMRYMHGDRRTLRFGWVVVDSTFRGRGYGTEMLRAGLKYAFEILDVDVVTLGVFENNESAHRCYRKAGFADQETVERELGRVIEMALRKEDYR